MKRIITRVGEWFNGLRVKRLNRYRQAIFEHDVIEYFSTTITNCCDDVIASTHIGIYNPVAVVTKVLEYHFGFRNYVLLHVHGIMVNTQDDIVVMTIHLHRPGVLIGKDGCDIDRVRSIIEAVFNRSVKIDIVEVRNDRNIPFNY